jgi:hypothetical protein
LSCTVFALSTRETKNFENILFHLNYLSTHEDFKTAGSIQYAYAQKSEQMLKYMNEEKNKMSTEIILHEASTVLQAAVEHASELSEVGVTDEEFHLMRVLITHVAAHHYTSLENKTDITNDVRDLKILKEVIFRTAEMRFGHTSNVLNEFKYMTAHKNSVVEMQHI